MRIFTKKVKKIIMKPMIKTDKKSLKYRIGLIAVCGVVAAGCLYAVSRSYDPLARYPYATAENRDVILTYLDADDIDYLITSQLEPEEFLPFISLPEFDVHNARLYTQAMAIQPEDASAVVHFVNRYRDQLEGADLKTLLSNYSYQDLSSWFDQNEEDTLIADPTDMLAIPGPGQSVWTYVPADLVLTDHVYLNSEAAQAFSAMARDYGRVMESDPLQAEMGYMSYEDAARLYEQYPDRVFKAGENELQLGYTVGVEGLSSWLAKDSGELSESEQELADWLKENAWRYGFVVRYPQGKESVTGHVYNPFLLRFVGTDNARKLYENGQVLEELS